MPFDYPYQNFTPFDPLLIEFCASLSKRLFKEQSLKHFPDLAALAYWLRRAHAEEIAKAFASLKRSNEHRAPRGLVFHIAPANVEVMFAYSWILSHLTGNANIVRLPSRRSEGLDLLIEAIHETLAAFPLVQKSTRLISYGHDIELTKEISSQADVRVLWGGDETVSTLRKIPLKVDGKELVFPDRFAWAAIEAKKFLELKTEGQEKVLADFYNDVFWYDQSACSSPRVLLWVGTEKDSQAASVIFYRALQDLIERKGYELPTSLVLKKETAIFSQAIVLNESGIQRFSNELTVIPLLYYSEQIKKHPGFGLLYALDLSHLSEMLPYLAAKDQTLTYFGFSQEEIQHFAVALNGKSLYRIVPLGKALSFDYIWDGYDLLQEFTRVISIQ